MLSEEERVKFSVSNSIMQAMIVLTPLLLSLIKHVFFVFATASALVQYTAIIMTHWKDVKRDGDVEFIMSFVLADLLCVLTIISYFMEPPTVSAVIKSLMNPMNEVTTGMAVEVFIIGATATMLVLWCGRLIISTIKYMRETAKP